MTVTGEQGQLRWGYHQAAILHPWTVTKDKETGRWSLAGTVASMDTFAVTQRPLMFVAPNNWRWPVLELQQVGASVSATLGPKEK